MPKIAALVIAALVIAVWGVTFVSTKALLASFSPFEILVIRYVMGYAALWCLCPVRLKFSRTRLELLFALGGLFGVTLYQFLENLAINYTNASNVSIIVSICPMITALFAQFFQGRKEVSPKFVLGFALAIAGVTMVSLNGISELHLNPAGDILALCAALSWGAYSTALTSINARGLNFLLVTRRLFFWAIVFMLPFVAAGLPAASGNGLHIELDVAANAARFSSWANLGNLAFLGLVASAACFVAWNKVCAVLGTVKVTVGIYMIPVVTILFAFLFLGEKMSAIGWLGTACTISGVFLSGRGRQPK